MNELSKWHPEVPPDVIIRHHPGYRFLGDDEYVREESADEWTYSSITEGRVKPIKLTAIEIEDSHYPGMLERACIAHVEVQKKIWEMVDRLEHSIFNPARDHSVSVPIRVIDRPQIKFTPEQIEANIRKLFPGRRR